MAVMRRFSLVPTSNKSWSSCSQSLVGVLSNRRSATDHCRYRDKGFVIPTPPLSPVYMNKLLTVWSSCATSLKVGREGINEQKYKRKMKRWGERLVSFLIPQQIHQLHGVQTVSIAARHPQKPKEVCVCPNRVYAEREWERMKRKGELGGNDADSLDPLFKQQTNEFIILSPAQLTLGSHASIIHNRSCNASAQPPVQPHHPVFGYKAVNK